MVFLHPGWGGRSNIYLLAQGFRPFKKGEKVWGFPRNVYTSWMPLLDGIPSADTRCLWRACRVELHRQLIFFLIFTPILGEDYHFDSYFSNGLKPPTRRVQHSFWTKMLGKSDLGHPFTCWFSVRESPQIALSSAFGIGMVMVLLGQNVLFIREIF